MAPCKRQVKAKCNLICSSCDSWIDFAKSGCVNSWAEVQADDFHFVCRGCTTVKYLQEQVIELRHMILMMTGQGETEGSRGGENDESRGGETEESRQEYRQDGIFAGMDCCVVSIGFAQMQHWSWWHAGHGPFTKPNSRSYVCLIWIYSNLQIKQWSWYEHHQDGIFVGIEKRLKRCS